MPTPDSSTVPCWGTPSVICWRGSSASPLCIDIIALLWSLAPVFQPSASSISVFRKHLKTHLFSHSFPESPVVPVQCCHFGHYNRSCYYYYYYYYYSRPILLWAAAADKVNSSTSVELGTSVFVGLRWSLYYRTIQIYTLTLALHPLWNRQPVQIITQQPWKTTLVFLGSCDQTRCSILNPLQLVCDLLQRRRHDRVTIIDSWCDKRMNHYLYWFNV